MSFLEDVWAKLAQKKNQQPKQTQFKEVYPGYRTIPIQKLERKQANKIYGKGKGIDLWKQKETTRIYTYMENAPFSNDCDNGFFTTFYKAYMQHGDLKLKPDQIWMMIMLWFTKYVDDNAEELRTAFVMHQGKKELVVQTDKNLDDWVPFMHGVIKEIKKNTVEGVVDKLECNFTTTGLFETMFSTALVMNTCKKYFDYTRAGGGCGVVNAHMAGTLEDWQNLEQKLANLQKFDVDGKLKRYIRGLKPVLEQFTQTFKGNAHLQFWNNLYFERKTPNAREYMPSQFINGWLIKFFTTREEITEVEELESFSVDIKYIDLDTGEITYFNLNGGCKGYSCVDHYVYTPHYSFAVVIDEKKMKKMPGQVRAAKAMAKHKERMMKKSQGTPMVMKKVVNMEFKKEVAEVNPEQVSAFLQPTRKKAETLKEVKISLKEGLGGFVDPFKMPSVFASNNIKTDYKPKRR